ncbi:MAG: hypothetical protein ACQEWV_14335 [Bacillota bacterium]
MIVFQKNGYDHYVNGEDGLLLPRILAKYNVCWTTLRGHEKLSMQAMLTFASMNLKKMANWTEMA